MRKEIKPTYKDSTITKKSYTKLKEYQVMEYGIPKTDIFFKMNEVYRDAFEKHLHYKLLSNNVHI